MAWQRGVAQTVPLVCYLDGEPTAPTAPIVATVNVEGAGFGAATNAAASQGNGAVSVALEAVEVGAWGFVRVVGANGAEGLQPYTAEGDWTAARAAAINTIATDVAGLDGDGIPTPTEIWAAEDRQLTAFDFPVEAEVDTEEMAAAVVSAIEETHGTGRYDAAGSIAAFTAVERIITDEAAALTFIRGDSHTVRYTLRDALTRAALDLSAYTDVTMTIKPPEAREDDDDERAVAQIAGTITDATGGMVEFALDGTDTDGMTLGADYDYDVQGIAGETITTFIRGKARRIYDVTRATD